MSISTNDTTDYTLTTEVRDAGDGSPGAALTSTFAPKVGTVDAISDALRQKAQLALTNNQTFLAIATPTNAQAVAQVQALTRQVNALIRLQLGQLDTTAGT